jgi:hypothetical protein
MEVKDAFSISMIDHKNGETIVEADYTGTEAKEWQGEKEEVIGDSANFFGKMSIELLDSESEIFKQFMNDSEGGDLITIEATSPVFDKYKRIFLHTKKKRIREKAYKHMMEYDWWGLHTPVVLHKDQLEVNFKEGRKWQK